MATVKGDVHDIGKNIVGVVLGCNGYEVIDLGVMVPWPQDPRDRASGACRLDRPFRPHHALAGRDARGGGGDGARGVHVPLLIGGATTSRAHTAVRIEPAYSGPVVHVLDASRAVGVASAPARPETQSDEFVAETRADYVELRRTARRPRRPSRPADAAEARANRLTIDWTAVVRRPRPTFTGVRAAPRLPARGAGRRASTGRPSLPPGSCPAVPRHPRRPTRGQGRALTLRRRPEAARPCHR